MKQKIKDSYFCQIKWHQHLKNWLSQLRKWWRSREKEKERKREREKERKREREKERKRENGMSWMVLVEAGKLITVTVANPINLRSNFGGKHLKGKIPRNDSNQSPPPPLHFSVLKYTFI